MKKIVALVIASAFGVAAYAQSPAPAAAPAVKTEAPSKVQVSKKSHSKKHHSSKKAAAKPAA